MGGYLSSDCHVYCEYCGFHLWEKHLSLRKPHTIEECLKRLKNLNESIYDEGGYKIDHAKVKENIARLAQTLEEAKDLNELTEEEKQE